MTDEIDWLKVCKKIGEKASEEVMKLYKTSESKSEIGPGAGGDITIKADKISEDIVIKELETLNTCISIISEERGEIRCEKKESPSYTVIVDPIDGSFNFKSGVDYFAISIAVLNENGEPFFGYVKNLGRGEEYYAIKGEGAFKNGVKIQTSKSETPRNVLFECSSKSSRADIELLARTFLQSRHSRALGAVALDLCLIADGTFDLLLYSGASRYLDIAAGVFILQQAGGIVSDFNGNEIMTKGTKLIAKNILACCNSKVQKQILEKRFETGFFAPKQMQ